MAQAAVNILTVVSLVGGLGSLAPTLVSAVRVVLAERAKLRAAEEKRFRRALGSDDIAVVGRYLEDTIGAFNLREYASNAKVAERVNAYLERLGDFLKTDAEIEQQMREAGQPTTAPSSMAPPKELDAVRAELRSGGIWNALARLRRHIEIVLRGIALANGAVDKEATSSAGQLLRLLSRHQVVPSSAFSNLRYAVAVCNKAIHGFEVSADEAEAALAYAVVGLRDLNRPSD